MGVLWEPQTRPIQWSRLKVSNALQTRFGPSKYTSLKTTLHNVTPTWKWRCRHLKSSIQFSPPQQPTSVGHCHYQEAELDGWFLILHIILETCTKYFMHKFNASFIFHFYILIRSTSWIWTNPSIERLKFESPSKWNSYEGVNLDEHWAPPPTNGIPKSPFEKPCRSTRRLGTKGI